MARLAVVATFYRRPDDIPRLAAAIRGQSRQPDEVWLMHERPDDGELLASADWGTADAHIVRVRIPRSAGRPQVVPFTPLINRALDETTAEYITYQTDDSEPLPEKYGAMAAALDARPDWQGVYCWQRNVVARGETHMVHMGHGYDPVRHGWLDHSQVMHRRTPLRWPIDLGTMHDCDWMFFRDVANAHGPFMSVPRVLDVSDRRRDALNATTLATGDAYFATDHPG